MDTIIFSATDILYIVSMGILFLFVVVMYFILKRASKLVESLRKSNFEYEDILSDIKCVVYDKRRDEVEHLSPHNLSWTIKCYMEEKKIAEDNWKEALDDLWKTETTLEEVRIASKKKNNVVSNHKKRALVYKLIAFSFMSWTYTKNNYRNYTFLEKKFSIEDIQKMTDAQKPYMIPAKKSCKNKKKK